MQMSRDARDSRDAEGVRVGPKSRSFPDTHKKKWRFFCGKARRWGRTWKERDAADAGDSQKDAGGISGERLFVCGHRPRSGAPFTERRRSAKPEVQLGNIRNEFHMNFDFFDTKKKPGKRKTR